VISPIIPLSPRKRRRPAALLGVVAIVAGLVLAGVAIGLDRGRAPGAVAPPPQRVAVTPGPGPAVERDVAASTARHARRPGRPVRIAIPAIGVRTRIVRLGLNHDGTLETPDDYQRAGWWSGGPRPGEAGAAVVVGHVDSKTGPGAFYALRKLRRGDAIRIAGTDGRVQRFVVRRLASFPKSRFPTKLVYGPTRRPTLRLITCSGTFDQSSGHYLDNTIVFARAAGGAARSG
jgi:hypothetical protein